MLIFIKNFLFFIINFTFFFILSFQQNNYSKDLIPYNTEYLNIHYFFQDCCEGCLYCKGNLLCLVCHADYYYYLTDTKLICLKKDKIKDGEGFTDLDSRLVYKCPLYWGVFQGKNYCFKKCLKGTAPYLVKNLKRCVQNCEDFGMVVGKDNYHCVAFQNNSSSVKSSSSSFISSSSVQSSSSSIESSSYSSIISSSFESSSSSFESSSSCFESSSSCFESSSSSFESSSIESSSSSFIDNESSSEEENLNNIDEKYEEIEKEENEENNEKENIEEEEKII